MSNNSQLDDGTRKGGFSPSQWVLGKFPRNPGNTHDEDEFADLGVISAEIDPEAAFARLTQIRTACRGAFAAEDCSARVKRALLRKAAPLRGTYNVGDLVEFKREQGAKTDEDKWSPATRIIGFDAENVVWGLCNGVPVCVATDKIRPCSPEKALAFLYLNDRGLDQYVPASAAFEPQKYVNETRDIQTSPTEIPPTDDESLEENLMEEPDELDNALHDAAPDLDEDVQDLDVHGLQKRG